MIKDMQLVGIFLLLALTNTSPFAQEKTQPNVIMIMADDLGWGDVGFNGTAEIKTPELDAMARQGVRFTRFYTASPLCSPTRGSILTGRHPFRYGILAAHTGGMRVGENTIAEILKENNYTTGFFGKWHLGWVKPDDVDSRGFYSPPWHHGFDESFATQSAVPTWNPTITPEGWNAWGQKEGEPWKGGTAYVENGEVVTDNLEGDDSRVIMDRAIPFIKEASEGGKPFFSCIWFHTPHEPVVAGPEYREMYKEFSEDKQHYYGAISAMDEQIGRLRKELRALGIEKNTILWFCSDNGPADQMVKKEIASAGPFRGHKHTVYEGGLRVPALVEWPGNIPAGKSTDFMCGTNDYVPTVLDLAGITYKNDGRPMDGISIKNAINNEGGERQPSMGAGWKRLFADINGLALIDNRFKLVKPSHGNAFELYDLQNDPGETTDVKTQFHETFEKMKNELEQWEKSCQESRDGKDYQF